LIGKPEGNELLVRPSRKFNNNIKMDLKDMGEKTWTGFIWLRIDISGGVLWTHILRSIWRQQIPPIR
jgi:hypothetical protein